jgi:hypothetical protein
LAPKVRVSLLRCGTCGKPFTPFKAHVCNGRRSGRTRVRPSLSITSTCPSCGRPRGNPFTHTCATGGDFAARKRAAERQAAAARKAARAKEARERKRAREAERRQAAAERRRQAAARKRAKAAERRRAAADNRKAAAAAKRKAARPARPPHDYRTCADDTCRRYACLAWKEAWQEGRTTGLDDGYDLGYDAAATGKARR